MLMNRPVKNWTLDSFDSKGVRQKMSNNPYKNLSSHNKVRVNKTVEGKPVKTELTKYLDSLKREQENNND